MRVLVADDEAGTRSLLESILREWLYEVEVTADGTAAWDALQRPDPPEVAILDWQMPGLCGPEVCRLVRDRPDPPPVYLLLLTGRGTSSDIVAGLRSGANDYLTKPFQMDELAARLNVAAQMVALQRRLCERVRELESALARIKRLQGILPVCAWCKKVRNDQNYWRQVDEYLREEAGVGVTHGMCPDCFDRELTKLRKPGR